MLNSFNKKNFKEENFPSFSTENLLKKYNSNKNYNNKNIQIIILTITTMPLKL